MELKLLQKRKEMPESKLLIVPYGIETCISIQYYLSVVSFNRTLWN